MGFAFNITLAQKITITGVTKNQQGTPVAYVFIRDNNHPCATYSDSLGNYTIKADPNSTLYATSLDYGDTYVKINNSPNIDITLGNTTSVKKTNDQSANLFKDKSELTDFTSGSFTYFGSGQQELHGSKYFFGQGMHGYAINKSDSIRQGNAYLFNYDKVNGELLLTRDNKSMLQIDKGLLKEFVLFDGSGNRYDFVARPDIDANHYVEVVSTGAKYILYKSIKTRFEKDNYTTNGITTSGHNYDEYIDTYTYYLVKTGGQPVELSLKRKSLKTAFPEYINKVNKFMSDHSDSEINDDYLKQLVDEVNAN